MSTTFLQLFLTFALHTWLSHEIFVKRDLVKKTYSMSTESSVSKRCRCTCVFDNPHILYLIRIRSQQLLLQIKLSSQSAKQLLLKQRKRYCHNYQPFFCFDHVQRVWVGFVIGSCIAPKVFLQVLWFSFLFINPHSKFHFDQDGAHQP